MSISARIGACEHRDASSVDPRRDPLGPRRRARESRAKLGTLALDLQRLSVASNERPSSVRLRSSSVVNTAMASLAAQELWLKAFDGDTVSLISAAPQSTPARASGVVPN